MTYTERALSRIIYQYDGSPKVKQWMSILPTIAASNLDEPLERINQILDIDSAYGAWLDLIGSIVGQDRPYVSSEILGFFGWGDNPLRYGWGSPWLSSTSSGSSILMPDQYYKILLKAKIAKNTSDATIDGIIDAVEIITSTPVQTLIDGQDMTFSIIFADTLEPAERIMLTEFDIVPRPQGVKFAGFSDPAGGVYFGYVGDANARNYGVAPYAEIF